MFTDFTKIYSQTNLSLLKNFIVIQRYDKVFQLLFFSRSIENR